MWWWIYFTESDRLNILEPRTGRLLDYIYTPKTGVLKILGLCNYVSFYDLLHRWFHPKSWTWRISWAPFVWVLTFSLLKSRLSWKLANSWYVCRGYSRPASNLELGPCGTPATSSPREHFIVTKEIGKGV